VGGEEGALLVLEDLHWACGDTLAVVEYLAESAAMSRLLVLGTSLPHGPALPVIDSLERRGAATMRSLDRLSAKEINQMAAACLEIVEDELPDGVPELLEARTDGVPFLVEELLANIVTRGALVMSDAGWEVQGPLEAVDVPLSFAVTVRQRLSQLSEAERRVVRTAAILGRDFDWSHVPIVTRMDESEVLEALSRAVDLQFVEEIGGDRFRFRHALTVEAILAEMLDPQRSRLAAKALEKLVEELVEEPEQGPSALLELAAHLALQAGRPADAARYLIEVARRSLSRGALATAIATTRRARGLVERDGPDWAAAGELLLAALSQVGDTASVDSEHQYAAALVGAETALGDADDGGH
jgi:predicted ATPase